MGKAMRLSEALPTTIPLAARVDSVHAVANSMDAVYQLEALASRHNYPVSERPVYATKDCKVETCRSTHYNAGAIQPWHPSRTTGSTSSSKVIYCIGCSLVMLF